VQGIDGVPGTPGMDGRPGEIGPEGHQVCQRLLLLPVNCDFASKTLIRYNEKFELLLWCMIQTSQFCVSYTFTALFSSFVF